MYFFVHIPKNAGTSVESALLEQRSCTESRPCKGRTWDRSPPLLHATSAEYQRACNATLFHSVPSAAILRRPLDRERSMYLYFSSGGNGSPDDLRKFASIRALCTRRTVHAWASKSSLNVLRKRTKAGLRKSSFGHKASLCCTVALQMMRNQPSQLHGYSAQSAYRMIGKPLQRALPALRKFALPSKPQRASAPSEALQTALDTPTPRTLHILEEDPFFTKSDNHLWNRHCGHGSMLRLA